jgi:uncharacterized protein (DUF58 family)
MRALFAGFTTRGQSFLGAGLLAVVAGLALGERALLSIGIAALALPLLATLTTSRARYRIRCVRHVTPPRVPAGRPAVVTLRVENVSRLPTGLLLAEDGLPYPLGSRPRFVLERIEPGGWRELNYPVQSEARGRYTIGPLQIRVADAFGLVELTRSFAATSTLVVTPPVIPLPAIPLSGNWRGEGGGRARTADTAGEDDVIPRTYRDGDELRRVHWRSTARHGELMVRREEQRWRNRAVLLLDNRARAHRGTGPGSSYEFAVTAVASAGVHLARGGIDGHLLTADGPATAPGSFEDALLDSLAVVKPSRQPGLSAALDRAPGGTGGLFVLAAGSLEVAEARRLAAARRDNGPAIALLLAASTWSGPGGDPEETAAAAAVLRAAGWRVAQVTAGTPLAAAWQRLRYAPAEYRPAPPPGPGPGAPAAGVAG